MVHEKFVAVELDDFRFLEFESHVRVTEHRGHGSNQFEFQNHTRQPNISGVQNVIDAGKKLWNGRVEVAMGVGDNADSRHERKGECGPAGLSWRRETHGSDGRGP